MTAETVHIIALSLSENEKIRLVKMLTPKKVLKAEPISETEKINLEQKQRLLRLFPFKRK